MGKKKSEGGSIHESFAAARFDQGDTLMGRSLPDRVQACVIAIALPSQLTGGRHLTGTTPVKTLAGPTRVFSAGESQR